MGFEFTDSGIMIPKDYEIYVKSRVYSCTSGR